MAKREIKNLELKVKLFKEYLNNGGVQKIYDPLLLRDLELVKTGTDGKPDPDTISPIVNAAMGAFFASHLIPPFISPESISEYQSFVQKNNCFEQQNIDTVEEFNQVYNEYKTKAGILYRGQREAKWRLYSKLQRHWLIDRMYKKEENYQTLLENIVSTGKIDHGTDIKKLLKEHNIDSENDMAVLSYLQHHGCPTPLLDWTFRFENALFFGLEGIEPNSGSREIEDYFSIYFIEEEDFESGSMRSLIEHGLVTAESEIKAANRQIGKEDGLDLEKLEDIFIKGSIFNRKRIPGAGLVSHMTAIKQLINIPLTYFSDKDSEADIAFSLNNSQNILNQEGVFTWNSDSFKPLEIVGNEQYIKAKDATDPDDYSFCRCFNIHKSLEKHIREYINSVGVIKEFIYPNTEISTWETFEKSKK